MKKIPFIVISLVLIFVAIYLLVSILNKDEIHLVEEVFIEDISEITVDSALFDVEVLPTPDLKLQVRLTGQVSKKTSEVLQLVLKQTGEKMAIGYDLKEDGFSFLNGFKFNRATLTVSIPEKDWEKLTIKTTSNNILLNSVYAKEVIAKTSSGNLTLQEVVANKISVTSTSGNQAIDNSSTTEYSGKTTSGNSSVTQLTAEKLLNESTSGEQSFKNIESKTLTLQSTSGTIEMKDLVGKSAMIKTTSAKVKLLLNKPFDMMSLNSTSGDITLQFKDKLTDLSLKTKHNSGKSKLTLPKTSKKGDYTIIGEGTKNLIVKTTSGDFELVN